MKNEDPKTARGGRDNDGFDRDDTARNERSGFTTPFAKDKRTRARIKRVEKNEPMRRDERTDAPRSEKPYAGDRNDRPRNEDAKREYAPRRNDSGNGGERRSYNPNFTKDNRLRDSDVQRKPYDRSGDASRRPYTRDDDRPARKPYDRDGDAPRRPYNDRDERSGNKPYDRDRNRDDQPFRKPYAKESGDAPRRPYTRDDDRPARKPYGNDDAPRKPYTRDGGDSQRKPYGRNDANRQSRDRNWDEGRNSYNRSPRQRFDNDEERNPGLYDEKHLDRRGKSAPRGGRPAGKKYVAERNDQGRNPDGSYPAFPTPPLAEEMRLNRYIAASGVCSRREADEIIRTGKVTVNGEVVTEMGAKVGPGDIVEYEGRRISSEKKVYIVMNKPKGFVTTLEDPHADKTVMDLLKNACSERVYPVGRLDKNSLGVLLITNDGDLTTQLTHPSYSKKKIYQVTLDKAFTKADMIDLLEGIELEDGEIRADAADYVSTNRKEVGIEIHSGRNRIVRRMFEHLGYKVTKLDRVYFAGLTKKNLKRGQWRFLSTREVEILKSGKYE